MAWRNLGRNRRRTAISIAAVAFAVFSMVVMRSLQQGAYAQLIDNSVKIQTGHLQVQAPGYLESNDINLTVDHLDQVYAVTDRLPEVVGAVGRITTGMLVARGEQSFGALVIGADAAREQRTSSLPHMVRVGRFLDAGDPNGVLVGDKLAKNLFAGDWTGPTDENREADQLKGLLGREIIILGQAVDGSTAAARMTLQGIIRTGQLELDRAALVINLALLQDIMMMPGRVNEVAILLDGYQQIPEVRRALTNALANLRPAVVVVDWKQVAPALAQGITLDSVSGRALVFLLLLVVAFGILNTFLMSAFERFREFGMLMAIGVRPRTCGGTLLVESQLLMAMGFAIGAAAGGVLAYWLQTHGLHIPNAESIYEYYGVKPIIYSLLTADTVVKAFLQVWVVTIVVALYPAWKITRFRPVEALRRV